MQTEGGVFRELQAQVYLRRGTLRETVGVGGQSKRAAVVFSGGVNVKQWKSGWAEVNKDC